MTQAGPLLLTVDGRTVGAAPGQTVLEVARREGIEIPALCHDPRLPPYGACLLCCVEVEGARRLLLACATEVREGMAVRTSSERVLAARKQILELLLSNHFADCRGPCHIACPAHVDVQGYLALAAAGRHREALALVRETNPLPSVCGRICVRYCERACRRREVDTAVAINLVKRHVADAETARLARSAPVPRNGHRVAVVGGGPAGLTAAYFLARRGYDVRIFDAHPRLGGTLRYGIPEFMLPSKIIDIEIKNIMEQGVSARLGVRIGRDVTLDELVREGFEATFLALGAMKGRPLGVPGEGAEGVLGGLDFLAAVKRDRPPVLGGTAVTVGGGNTAIDAARTALRCGAARSLIVYRRTREEMPADAGEIEDALEEGVQMAFLVAPIEVQVAAGRVAGLRCARMRLGEPDASGRRRPAAIPGAEETIACDTIIAAIGQDVDLGDARGEGPGALVASAAGTLRVDPRTFATDRPGVFAAGDVVTGPAAAVDAIGAGRLAALSIDTWLQTGRLVGQSEFLSRCEVLGEIPRDRFEGIPRRPRAVARKLQAEARARSWDEADQGLAPERVAPEAGRCLSCGCSAVFDCELKRWADRYGAEPTRMAGKVRKHAVDLRHPLIALDPNKCILCGRCVRLCGELLDVGALGFVRRGFETMVRPSMQRALQATTCIACGNCIETCPTGAIAARPPEGLGGPWRLRRRDALCNFCGVGCELALHTLGASPVTVTARRRDADTPGEICVRGRFGQRVGQQAARVVEARVCDRGRTRAVPLDEAIGRAVDGLRGVVERRGAGALAVLVSGKATNEEIALAEHLARDVFGTDNVACCGHLARSWDAVGLEASLGLSASTLPLAEVERAQTLIVVNADPPEDNPVLGFHLRRAARKGAALVCVSSTGTGLAAVATRCIDARRGTSAALLEAVAAQLVRANATDEAFVRDRTEGYAAWVEALPRNPDEVAGRCGVAREAISALAEALRDRDRRAIFVYDDDATQDRAPGDLQAIANLLLLTGRFGRPGHGLVVARRDANAQGALDLGAFPGARSGEPTLAGAHRLDALRAALDAGLLRGLLIIGEDVAADLRLGSRLDEAEHVVVVEAFETATSGAAHVVLPGSLYAESTGSATAMDRRVRAFEPALPAPAGVTGFDVLARLCGAATGSAPPTLAQVRASIVRRLPRYGPLATLAPGQAFPWSEDPEPADLLFARHFATPNGRARFLTPDRASRTFPHPRAQFSALESRFADAQRRLFQRPPA